MARAVVAVLASVLLLLAGTVAGAGEAVEPGTVREEVPLSALAVDGSPDEGLPCVPEQGVARPGRVGRPVGRRSCPQAGVSGAAGAGGPAAPRPPAGPGGAAVAAGHACHSVLRC
ncbi:hypothetical protein GCM10010218_10030 [Streptomyces mashuensis]|uniref:Secreted protein n=1 Tax=Streptomyces mashuensis TaxID=33904 RepID=A0A919AZ49_9ACTN|nr:hypothetical protein GCM10010218_10030 [Streptomyces mashuensis]